MTTSIYRLKALALSLGAGCCTFSGITNAEVDYGPSNYVFCGDPLQVNAFQRPLDYNSLSDAEQVRLIEFNHLNRDVETLVRGQTSDSPIDDLAYILRQVPNHHRALALMADFQLANGYVPQYELNKIYTADCYFRRALNLDVDDATVHLIYAIYLHKSGELKSALREYLIARDDGQPDAQVHYNLGLLYVDLGQYGPAREEARKAYELGYPLGGLKSRLSRLGEWMEE